MPEEKTLSREKLFCCWYSRLGSVQEAARLAGFSEDTALAEGLKLLESAKYRRYINKLSKCSMPAAELVRKVLERLAFGSASDAAALVFSESMPSPESIARMDLFNVSEIKRVKGGGVEVKLFDRQKALEKLYEQACGADTLCAADNLIEALTGMEVNTDNEV